MRNSTNDFKDLSCEQQLFVRLVNLEERDRTSGMTDYVKPPFKSSGSVSRGGNVNGRNQHKWVLGLQIGDQSWIPVFSNACSSSEIFKLTAKSKKIEAVCVGYDSAKRGWTFEFSRAGTRVIDFSLKAIDCATTLVSLGAQINGDPGDDPPMIDAATSFLGTDHALKTMEILLALGADINAQNPWTGETALHLAVSNRNMQVIRFLLNNGADIGIRNRMSQTPREWLIKRLETLTGSAHDGYAAFLSVLPQSEA